MSKGISEGSDRGLQIYKSLDWLTFLLLQNLAFSLLPLFVYLIVFFALGENLDQVLRLPEWMFITVVLYGDTARRQISFYQLHKGFELQAVRTISWAVLGIVTSCVFLTFSTIAQYSSVLTLSDAYYYLQLTWFVASLLLSLWTSMVISRRRGDDGLLAYRVPTGGAIDREPEQVRRKRRPGDVIDTGLAGLSAEVLI